MSKKIKLIVGSTRQGRKAEQVATWLVDQAKNAGVDLEVLDLKAINLPNFEEPVSPMYKPVDTPEAKKWAEQISSADGLVFLTAEYNRSIPASLKNAIDYLYGEWEGKKSLIVSYGYIDGGGSAAKHLKDIIDFVKTELVADAINIPFTADTFNDEGKFNDIDSALSTAKQPFIDALQKI